VHLATTCVQGGGARGGCGDNKDDAHANVV
jgi:hypothetical protein